MDDCIRISDSFEHSDEDKPSNIWEAIESIVEAKRGIKPFAQLKRIDDPLFQYLPSNRRKERFDIIANHQKFTTDVVVDPVEKPSGLGPIEQDIVAFARLKQPHFAALKGGAGSGKSTTLRYLIATHLKDLQVQYCDLDTNLDAIIETPDLAPRLLSNYMAVKVNELIPAEDEFTKLWTWGLTFGDVDSHNAKYVLAGAQTKLRKELDARWLDESPEAIRIRKQCHDEIIKNPLQYLEYLALEIDYYLTQMCDNERARLLIVLDNIDPLPPTLQQDLMNCALRLQESAKCKMLVAMRPLTYSINLQSGHRTIYVIGHLGPPPFDLIEARVDSLILNTDLGELKIQIGENPGNKIEVGEREVKLWLKEVLASIRQQSGNAIGEMSAKTFIEGVSNNNLRHALLIAPKIFGSHTIPFALPLDGATLTSSGPARIRSHELIRAALVGWHAHFEGKDKRVIDNIFELGRAATCSSLTCKIRILKKLAAAPNGFVSMNECREHLAHYGYSDETILESINAVISQPRRLALSDTVVAYRSLSDAPLSKLEIMEGGRFYVTQAIFNLEYVQEVHLDVLLPRRVVVLNYNDRKFSHRVGSLLLFLRHLHDEDLHEVCEVLGRGQGKNYKKVYGTSLFSTDMTIALARQVENVGRVMMNKAHDLLKREIEQSLQRWEHIDRYLEREDADIRRKLESIQ